MATDTFCWQTRSNCLQSRALCHAVCAISIAIVHCTLLNWPIVSLLILFILFSMFSVLIHDYTLCFTGFPCCNFSYYNYISIWSYYIVIHLVNKVKWLLIHLADKLDQILADKLDQIGTGKLGQIAADTSCWQTRSNTCW